MNIFSFIPENPARYCIGCHSMLSVGSAHTVCWTALRYFGRVDDQTRRAALVIGTPMGQLALIKEGIE